MTHQSLLVMLVGIPGSGKSYFAKQLAPAIGAVRLNGDSMKTALYGSYDFIRKHNLITESNQLGFAAIDYAAEEVLRAGYSVIYDANNNRQAIREKHRVLALKYGAMPIVVWIRVPESIAKSRVVSRRETADQPSFNETLFEEVLRKQAANFGVPTAEENLIEIDGVLPFEEQYREFEMAARSLQAKW